MLQTVPTDCAAGCEKKYGYLIDGYEDWCKEKKSSGILLSRAGIHMQLTRLLFSSAYDMINQ